MIRLEANNDPISTGFRPQTTCSYGGIDVQLETNDEERVDDLHATELYEMYGRLIARYLRLHGLSLEDTEDLLVEIFLVALEHDNLSAFPPQAQLAWLRRVAHNKLLNTYRRVRRHPQVSLDSIAETHLEEGPEQLTLQQEEYHQLRTHIQQLPTLQQHLLQLRYGEGLHHAEIAILLNKREGAVRKLLSRALLFLRRAYQQPEGEDRC